MENLPQPPGVKLLSSLGWKLLGISPKETSPADTLLSMHPQLSPHMVNSLYPLQQEGICRTIINSVIFSGYSSYLLLQQCSIMNCPKTPWVLAHGSRTHCSSSWVCLAGRFFWSQQDVSWDDWEIRFCSVRLPSSPSDQWASLGIPSPWQWETARADRPHHEACSCL